MERALTACLIVGHHEVWAGDGTSTVKVIDLFSQKLTHTISTGGANRADELCLDPRHHLVMVANNADFPPFASIISTAAYGVVKKIAFDGTNGAPNSNNGAEQCQWDHRTGKFYISIPGNSRSAGRHRRRGGDRPHYAGGRDHIRRSARKLRRHRKA